MRASLLLIAVALASCVLLTSAVSIHHRGVLNHRLTAEQHAAAEQTILPQWLTQKLDHQALSSSSTFQQRFFVNDTFWNPQRPRIFLIIGGEGPISPAYVTDHFNTGHLSAEFGALQVALEHRFYGQSVPNNDSSTANLRYLSSAQALEDLVTLHELLTERYAVTAQWIVFGGSYSGSLSAWARLKYPQLFLGSISASAPVRAELDFYEYMEVIDKSLGAQCSELVAASTTVVTDLLASPTGLTQLQQAFNICSPIGTADVANFLSTLTNPFTETVQYNDDAGRTSYDIGTICGLMESAADPLSGLIAVWNSYNNHTGVSSCADVGYASMIASLQSTSDARSWTWQTCIEFGYFQSARNGSVQPFSPLISLEFFLQQCTDIFGIQGLSPKIDYINDYYGADHIVSDNTVFTQGTVDPWHILGNYQTYPMSALSASILIQGTAHCADLYAAEPTDLPGLTGAREAQEAFIMEWFNVSGEKKESEHKKKTRNVQLSEQ